MQSILLLATLIVVTTAANGGMPTDEQLEEAEKYKDFAKCKACEDLVEEIEKQMAVVPMGETIQVKQKKKMNAMKEARAIEILEKACDKPEAGVGFCQEAIDYLEDDLTEYIMADKVVEDFKNQVCTRQCKAKQDMRDQIKDMSDKFTSETNDPILSHMKQEVLSLLFMYGPFLFLGFGGLLSVNLWLRSIIHRKRQEIEAQQRKAQ
eukprot:TRINITY_DN679_c1_g1_i1.p1 TRINITY_DN679_c1_g1~~TRINITY_DN679_c1_g1_i1.p1  ORF type:complete len:233 (+),score=74.13 TRINITY_DN679_c1_g1_i1:79-699(+)